MNLRVAFRADVSVSVGTGHLRRCRSVATALRSVGAEVIFVGRAEDSPYFEGLGETIRWISCGVEAEADAVATAATLRGLSPDWVVVDHYRLDARWHEIVRRVTGAHVLAIDDLADRALAPDLLVDHNIGADGVDKYNGRIVPAARCLLGPRYALLAPDYATSARHACASRVKSIGIFMGGNDARNACALAVLACRESAGFAGAVEVVSSHHSPHLGALKAMCARWPSTKVLMDLPDMRDFFVRHDLYLGAGGGAALERCCLGAPTVAIAVASNQLASLPSLDARGAIQWIRGDADPELVPDFALDASLQARLGEAVARLIRDPDLRRSLSERSRALVDGRGAERVAAVMDVASQGTLLLRSAGSGDETLLFEWANDPSTRTNAFQSRSIPAQEHHLWFQARLADTDGCRLYVLEAGNAVPVAQVRLDRLPDGWQISYSVDVAFRGWGVGRRALSAVLQPFLLEHPGACISARVMLHNVASVRIFEQLGFSQEQVVDHRGTHLLFKLTPEP